MEASISQSVQQFLDEHKRFFESNRTREVSFRLQQLQKLRDAIHRHEGEIVDALYKDLHKSKFEAYATEIDFTLESIKDSLAHLRSWMKPQKVRSPLHIFPAKSFILSEPYGTVLIIGPFNYPFQLLIEPLIGAIAAGNCAVLKPATATPTVTAVVTKIISTTFDPHYIRVMEGGRETMTPLIHAPFDYIFFTGSVPVGKIVMKAAAENLVPVTLELGGKSPVIVDSSANIDRAAKRIMWGKCLNAGQTCIAPDYVLVQSEVKERLIVKMKEALIATYGMDAQQAINYGRIVNAREFDRVAAILERDAAKIVYGGKTDSEDLYIEPTILDNVSWDSAAMEDELFGPILPVLEYRELDEAINMINRRPKPLALYLFTENKAVEEQVLSRISFGGGCVNDTIMHVTNSYLPFGGVGDSGMGAYHGKRSFDLFSHRKSIVNKGTCMDPGIFLATLRQQTRRCI